MHAVNTVACCCSCHSMAQAVEAVARKEGALLACKALCGTWWDLWGQAFGAQGICCLEGGSDDVVHVLRGHSALGTLVEVRGDQAVGVQVSSEQ